MVTQYRLFLCAIALWVSGLAGAAHAQDHLRCERRSIEHRASRALSTRTALRTRTTPATPFGLATPPPPHGPDDIDCSRCDTRAREAERAWAAFERQRLEAERVRRRRLEATRRASRRRR